MNAPIHIILGPTASGKERAAVLVAEQLGADIISADSMKIYREMRIGTASPPPEFRARVRHWCVEIADPSESFSVAKWVAAAEAAMAEIEAAGRPILFSGGTALYYKGLVEGLFNGPSAHPEIRARIEADLERLGPEAVHGQLLELDPAAGAKIHPNDRQRVIRALEVVRASGKPISGEQTQFGRMRTDRPVIMVGLNWPRATLYERVHARVDRMVSEGLVDEARRLFERVPSASHQARQAVGYAELFRHFAGDISLDEAVELIKQNSRHLAKHQITWFRKFPCQWIAMDDTRTPEDVAAEILERFRQPDRRDPPPPCEPSIR